MDTRPGELPDSFEISHDATELPPDRRDEPALPLEDLFVGFEDVGEPARWTDLEEQHEDIPDEAPVLVPPSEGRGLRPSGPVASIIAHALVIGAILWWHSVPVDTTAPIPVELVIEQPPPPPAEAEPEKPPESKPAPSGPLASEDFGEVAKTPEAAAGAPSAPEEPPQPKPEPAPESQPPAPEPPKQVASAPIPIPKPKPTPRPPAPQSLKPPVVKPAAAPQPLRQPPAEMVHTALRPGPAATRDEYLAYLLVLTRRHLDMLPISFVGDRHGETVIGIRVLADGTIARISIAESSGYPDIDERIERMVTAVGRFPPLPQWVQAPMVDLQLSLRFPEALAR